MGLDNLLKTLKGLDLKLESDGTQLRIKGDIQKLTPPVTDALKHHKPELLKIFSKTAMIQSSSALDYPASYNQTSLWHAHQASDNKSLYNISSETQIKGKLDISLLHLCFEKIVLRHDAIRSVFSVDEGTIKAEISNEVRLDYQFVDLTNAPRQIESLNQVKQDINNTEFNLETGPLLRIAVVQLESDLFILLMTIHHIISDGWSMGVLIKELCELYLAHGNESKLAPLPLKYGDYAIWQQQHDTKSTLDYWQKQLAHIPHLITLPWDFLRPSHMSNKGNRFVCEISDQLSYSLKTFAKQQNSSLYILMLSAFQALLSLLSGQSEVVVGSPSANRKEGQTDCIVGYFVNVLPIATKVNKEQEFSLFLKKNKEQIIASLEHQETPLEDIINHIKPERSSSYTPLFQTMFALQNAPKHAITMPGLIFQSVAPETLSCKYDLLLSISEQDKQLVCHWEYCSDLFLPQTIQHWADLYQHFLQGVIANCDATITELFQPDEMHTNVQLTQWSGRTTTAVPSQSLAEYVEQHALQRPSALAVTGASGDLTYQQLNQQANRLAHKLAQSGVSVGDRVGFVTRSAHQAAIVMLGIVKLGAAYVPLDPSYPQERLTLMLQDAEPSVLIADDGAPLNWAGDIPVLTLAECDNCSMANPGVEIHSSQLAYICYTSGTTGRPKGVMVPHRAVVTLVKDTNYVQLTTDSKIAQLSNLSFDAATFEFWGALLNGATLVEVNRNQLLDAVKLKAVFDQFSVSDAFLTNSLFCVLAFEQPTMFNAMTTLIVGGEAMSLAAAKHVMRSGGPARLLNGYGPTENTTFSTWYELQNQGEGLTTVPIGKPLSNREVYLLDGQQQLLPTGVIGELYVGGAGIATGYWRQPQLTAEKFVAHPFSPGEKLYRTGDLCRFNQDGELIYISRADSQVKLRGFRIELGEIEAVISQSEFVQDALVIVSKNVNEENALVAYIVGDASSEAKIREYIKKQLPLFMVPTHLVFIKQIPLTANGKADIKALPQPIVAREELYFEAPSSDIEQLIANIWGEFIQVNRIGRHDDFFQLGGNSLLLARVNGRIAAELGLNMSIGKLFELSILRELAEYVVQLQSLKSDDNTASLGGELVI